MQHARDDCSALVLWDRTVPPFVSRRGGNAAASTAAADDPFLWLEQVDSARAMDWVRAENAKTAAVLEQDPRYPVLYREALTIAQAQDRIPQPGIIGGQIYNFWQDADHAHGLWRRTTLPTTGSPQPAGRPCSISTPCPKPRKPTGSGAARIARSRPSAAA